MPLMADCPVFSFGGSYGGMLTTWFRLKYPNVVMGGLAASAPFNFLGSGISPYAFSLAASETFNQAGPNCGPMIKTGFELLASMAQTDDGRKRMSSYLQTCSPITSTDNAISWINWIVDGLTGEAMLDYPYPTNYGIHLNAWPVNASCKIMTQNPSNTALGLCKAASTFYNATGALKCYKLSDGADWGTCCGWNYLACTEVYQPYGQSGIWPQYTWNLSADKQYCQSAFKVQLEASWSETQWGSFKSISQGSHIIFSNGLLDPWHTSGVLESLGPTLPAIVIPESAHHLDLRAPNKADPIYVQQARIEEVSYIDQWFTDYFA